MRLVFTLFVTVLAYQTFAQKTIKLQELVKHVGDSVKVCGKVYDTYYALNAPNSPTFLNIGGIYPNYLLNVVIWGDIRSEFKQAPELYFKHKNVCIIGKVELFENKPQFYITNPIQIILQ